MAILLPCIVFLLLLLIVSLYVKATDTKRDIVLITVIAFSLIVLAITIVLSPFQQLAYQPLLAAWTAVAVTCGGALACQRNRLGEVLSRRAGELKDLRARCGWLDYLAASVAGAMAAVILFQALAYPPNNYDSMTYHMARVASWVANGSVDTFVTNEPRQLYQPPFAEYTALHFNVLTGDDCFANTIQFFYLLGCCVIASLLTRMLGLPRFYQSISIVLCITLPEATLQASSTQNDLVVSFFALSACYFSAKAFITREWASFILVGICIGLAMLTKGTAFVYLAPLVLAFVAAVAVCIWQEKSLQVLKYSLIIPALIIFIVGPVYISNYRFSGNILGLSRAEHGTYSNVGMTPVRFVLAVLKNLALHSRIKNFKYPSVAVSDTLHSLHQWLGEDINSPETNFASEKFTTDTRTVHEDFAPNPFHLLLIVSAFATLLVCMLLGRVDRLAIFLLALVLAQGALFCAYLKWMPYHTRLHSEIFLLAIPLVAYAMSLVSVYRAVCCILLSPIIFYSFVIVLNNDLRPIDFRHLQQPRYLHYFNGRGRVESLRHYKDYKRIREEIARAGYTDIGLRIPGNSFEYPLFVDCYARTLRPVHIGVDNYTTTAVFKERPVQCIVHAKNDGRPASEFEYKGVKYHNVTPENELIFLFAPNSP